MSIDTIGTFLAGTDKTLNGDCLTSSYDNNVLLLCLWDLFLDLKFYMYDGKK